MSQPVLVAQGYLGLQCSLLGLAGHSSLAFLDILGCPFCLRFRESLVFRIHPRLPWLQVCLGFRGFREEC